LENTVDQQNLIEREKLKSKLRDQARQFRELFSTPLGKSVLETLSAKFQTAAGFPPNQLDNQGRTDALQTWRKLGHHDVMAYVNLQIAYKESDHGNTSQPGP
jgi:hypothetical protein